MNKLLLFCLLFCSSFVFAQQAKIDSTILEQFDNNLNEWGEWDTPESAASIKDGSYTIEHKRAEGSWAFWQSFQADLRQDFTIESQITQTEGADNIGFGLLWGFTNWNNYNTFLITSNGYFYLGKMTDGVASVLQAYTANDQIKGMGTPNILKVQQNGNEAHFYINGKDVFQTAKNNLETKGSMTGFLLFPKKARVDYLSITGKFPKINFVKDPIKGYKRENLGPNINSIYSELGPIISPDGNTLYLVRKNSPDNIGGAKAPGGEDDAWYAEKNPDGTWGKAKNIGAPINNAQNNFVTSISADNNVLFLANLYKKDGSSGGPGLSKSERIAKGWSAPQTISIKNYYTDSKVADYFVSQDQQFILYAISRKDTYGGQDIYVSIRNDKSSYSEPLNLGSIINTGGTEMSPFLASDNKTLYFSSDGHPGLGDNDIFVTRRLDDSWKKWSIPENLGPEVNSKEWDGDFSIPASGEYAFLSSSSNSMGGTDIVKITLSTTAKPNPVMLVKGKVLNKKTNEPLDATISYLDMETNQEVGTAVSDPKTGQYNIILQVGKKYSFRAQKDKFYAINDFLDISALNEYTEKQKDLYLVPLEVGQTIRLNNIFFDLNKAVLKNQSNEELDRLISLLNQNPNMEIEISGHTDNQGADDYNLTLSQQRVESVVAYLTSKGIAAARLKGKGYGESKAIASNETEEGRAINRRVDFTILKQ